MAKLYFYYAAMNAGKSTTLVQSSYNYQERGMSTVLFTPAFDERFQAGKVHSRIGLQADAVKFTSDFNLFTYVKLLQKDKGDKLRCVLIDEAQFLSKRQVSQLTDIVDTLKIPVLCYGLRADFRGELFPGSQYLLAWGDELIELKTICHCGRKASMNLRIDGNGNAVKSGAQVQIGGNESYIALCRIHYKESMQQSLVAEEAFLEA